jgi:hypothetical protein
MIATIQATPKGLAALSRILVLALILTGTATRSAMPEGNELHAEDLINVAQTLLAKGPQVKAYIGRKFVAEGKYRSGPVEGQNPVEIEFADFAVKGRMQGADEVHVLCGYSRGDPALGSLLALNLHSIPVLNVSGTVSGADRYDSEGMIVAFVKLKDCTVTKKDPAGVASPKNITGCTLIVDGKQFINGPCEFTPFGDGSFKIMKGPWFAYVNLDPDQKNRANGSWNENPRSNHAESQLGALDHHGECWSNERAIICARE